jgi:protein-tyrosine phosphatase
MMDGLPAYQSVCFVCLGNICRSPTAEAVFAKLVKDAGREDEFFIDSAGTAGYHAGERADSRSRAAAHRRGYDIRSRARQFERDDFERFDIICVMDADNLRALEALAAGRESFNKVALLRSFDASAPTGAIVPDPYYGGERGFDEVIDICERACRGLLKHLSRGAKSA